VCRLRRLDPNRSQSLPGFDDEIRNGGGERRKEKQCYYSAMVVAVPCTGRYEGRRTDSDGGGGGDDASVDESQTNTRSWRVELLPQHRAPRLRTGYLSIAA